MTSVGTRRKLEGSSFPSKSGYYRFIDMLIDLPLLFPFTGSAVPSNNNNTQEVTEKVNYATE